MKRYNPLDGFHDIMSPDENGVWVKYDEILETLLGDRLAHELEQLLKEWERRSRNMFLSAELEKDAIGKRLIEHGAMCYCNCVYELKKVLEDKQP